MVKNMAKKIKIWCKKSPLFGKRTLNHLQKILPWKYCNVITSGGKEMRKLD